MLTTVIAMTLLSGTDSVRLHLADAHGQAIANHQVWLMRTNSTKRLRPFGVLWEIPTLEKFYTSTTNASGNAVVRGVPKGIPMMVITRFGPRFDPKLSMDVIKLEGSVKAGESANAMIASDYEVTGQITEYPGGKPLAGVLVTLADTPFGHMGGYPGTDLLSTRTDASGNYRFRNLPNCSFTVCPAPPAPAATESRLSGGPWHLENVTMGAKDFSGTAGPQVLLKDPSFRCDFQVSKPGTVKVTVLNYKPGNRFEHVYLTIRGGGFEIGRYGPTMPFYLLRGTYPVLLEWADFRKQKQIGSVTVSPGGTVLLSVTVPENLAGSRG